MIIKIEELDEKRWPATIRKRINELIRLRNRVNEIKYGNVISPTWEQGENGEVITLPKAMGGGVSEMTLPFTLIKVSDGAGVDKVFRLLGSTVLGPEPTFSGATADGPDWLVTVTATGKLWAEIAYDDEEGTLISVALDIGSSTPSNSTGNEYVQIGRYEVDGDALTVHNDRYGPVLGSICRDWFASEAPYHGVNITG